MQEAKRQITLVNSEFKATSSGMDDWKSSTDGVSAKIRSLNKVLEQQENILKAEQEQLILTEQEYGSNSTAAENLRIKINNQQATVNRTKKEIADYENQLETLRTAEENAGDSAQAAGKGLQDSGKEAKSAGEKAEGSAEGFTVLKGTLSELAADVIRNLIEEFKELMTETESAYNKFQAQTGASTEEMKAFKAEMDDLYNNAYGESLEDIGDKMAYVKEYELADTQGWPFQLDTKMMEKSIGAVVVPTDLETNVDLLHRYLFDVEDYETTDEVKEISKAVSNRTGKTAADTTRDTNPLVQDAAAAEITE